MNAKIKTSRNPWPIAIVCYFICFFLFTAVLVTYAARQKMDLVRGDYYDEEIRYQEQLDRMNRTLPINNQVAVNFEPAAQCITVALPPGHAQRHATGRIRLYRPADENLDQDIPLALDNAGAQRIDTTKLKAGLWKVRIYWSVDGQDYYFTETVVVTGHS